MNKTIIIIVLLLAFCGGIFYLGRVSALRGIREINPVSSQIILDRIQDQYFLITKTLYLDEEVRITLAEAPGWRELFTGNTITTRGTVRVDIGVDLKGLQEDDITVDEEAKRIMVSLPHAQVLDSSVFGDIEVVSSKGLWTSIKDFFKGDEDERYNFATKELIAAGVSATHTRSEVYHEAEIAAGQMVQFIITTIAPGYNLEMKSR